MHQAGSLIVYPGFLAVIFVIVLIILGAAFARVRQRQRIEREKGPGKVFGAGGAPLTDEQSPRYQQTVQPNDADVGGNARLLPTAQDVEHIEQEGREKYDGHHENDAGVRESSVRQAAGKKPGGNATNHH
jgi:hypothetical protein